MGRRSAAGTTGNWGRERPRGAWSCLSPGHTVLHVSHLGTGASAALRFVCQWEAFGQCGQTGPRVQNAHSTNVTPRCQAQLTPPVEAFVCQAQCPVCWQNPSSSGEVSPPSSRPSTDQMRPTMCGEQSALLCLRMRTLISSKTHVAATSRPAFDPKSGHRGLVEMAHNWSSCAPADWPKL